MRLPTELILHIEQKDKDELQTEWQGELVRCKDCRHRIVNEHYGEEGYLKIKAMCDLDTGDIFALGREAYNDEWFCADGERQE